MPIPDTLRNIRRDVRRQCETRGSVVLATWDAEVLLRASVKRRKKK